ncbi:MULTISPECIES: ABC transporter substrate-binding protein [Mycobacterium]|uniref:Nitrate ABC transporter, periplasmic protein n=2 Tax=Mycobacterium kiyosense TaxID=2871094 RepID=A0A9P3Q7A6_9MYCO|nr:MULTISPECIES: ABC transporter substrate-binding protein [Mycobacterium]BDB43158.1 putative nitrate ABC transporter, periplasmic protein [Mycobacterium kiyosense]BDE13634.1 putative nitrate ABC transporter, periplasmic protein [Mycobacterium sp. 20KCMC460]GLB86844.1 putative nitrate ABC transporter, periplasmic protein [Mycobacterium kiyosense]GLB91436.1 putative nitrate ABC transporter, periplasmic protein [Mycobacterium kiyosense]GLB98586.1 putative nitrate ABC transporter, periplasmic pro
MKLRAALMSVVIVAATLSSGCSLESMADSAGVVNVVVGYQSKTINTVTAGTLLRAQGYLEHRLADITARTGTRYAVRWQDYDTGAPITAQMLAEKIDIGSMGDYPLLINGSKTQANPRARTELVSVTGYNPKGALNMVVVKPDSAATTLADLSGTKVSASVGSAGHGTLVRALAKDNVSGVDVLNQQPQVGASALESGQVQALSQFVAWPGLLVYQNKGKLLYDGAELDVPTLHGVVARRAYAGAHPEVLAAFLQAQLDATDFLNTRPLEAARIVAEASGLPQEVVYLYNGPGGTSFDATLKPSLVEALKGDVPYLKSIGDFADVDIDGFVQEEPLRAVFGARGLDYAAVRRRTTNPSALGGDPALASELWLDGAAATQPVASPTALLQAVRDATARGAKVRAAYVPDAELGTRWFADKAVWVRDGAVYRPFGTVAGARRYLAAHPGAVTVNYQQALGGSL